MVPQPSARSGYCRRRRGRNLLCRGINGPICNG
jgi:hypothetical protein